jgi:hypothetical protein
MHSWLGGGDAFGADITKKSTRIGFKQLGIEMNGRMP